MIKDPSKRLGSQNDYYSILILAYFSEISQKSLLVKEGPIIKKLAFKEKLKSKKINLEQNNKICTEIDESLNQYLFNRDLDEM